MIVSPLWFAGNCVTSSQIYCTCIKTVFCPCYLLLQWNVVLMHCSLPHNPYCCSLPSPMCMLHLLICTYLNSSWNCLPTIICVMLMSIVYLIQHVCFGNIVFTSLLWQTCVFIGKHVLREITPVHSFKFWNPAYCINPAYLLYTPTYYGYSKKEVTSDTPVLTQFK